MNFNIEQFKADVWYYSGLEGTIKSDTWEKIIAHSVNGETIPGDHFMADAYDATNCYNIKSIREQRVSKTGNQTIEFVQCRTPIANDRLLSNEELGSKILDTLDIKLNESLTQFEKEKMIDIIIVHKRYDDVYHATVYKTDHPDFKSYKLIWNSGEARLDEGFPWFIKRRWSDDLHRQTCTSIKRKYIKDSIIADIYVSSPNHHNISKEEILLKYNNQFYSDTISSRQLKQYQDGESFSLIEPPYTISPLETPSQISALE